MKTKMIYLTVAVEIDAEADEREVMEMPSKVAPEPADPAARASSKRQRVPCAVEAQAVRG